MKDYIDRAEIVARIAAEALTWGEDYDADQILGDIEDFPAADVVPWAWLEAYADGKRTNFCSGFVIEAKMAYNGEV